MANKLYRKILGSANGPVIARLGVSDMDKPIPTSLGLHDYLDGNVCYSLKVETPEVPFGKNSTIRELVPTAKGPIANGSSLTSDEKSGHQPQDVIDRFDNIQSLEDLRDFRDYINNW